ncbi:hypothetical protein JHN59_02285 [Streptomyces sp. MBT49]|uniref:hypothetical protein n=1 Tax=Streptomyces sp. MBT49 TaxID=1488380 RepID=UPI00190E217C|nr:hypothetical protein [Streptomyces sp. MBT49]MBK3623684.1 hypothetical protein [Streptomyces sp. MBT49]
MGLLHGLADTRGSLRATVVGHWLVGLLIDRATTAVLLQPGGVVRLNAEAVPATR